MADYGRNHKSALRTVKRQGRPSVSHVRAPSYVPSTGTVTPGGGQVAGFAVVLPLGEDVTTRQSSERWPEATVVATSQRAIVVHAAFDAAEVKVGDRIACAAFQGAPAIELDVDGVSVLAPDGRPILYDCLVRKVA